MVVSIIRTASHGAVPIRTIAVAFQPSRTKHVLEIADGFRVEHIDHRLMKIDLYPAAARLLVKVG